MTDPGEPSPAPPDGEGSTRPDRRGRRLLLALVGLFVLTRLLLLLAAPTQLYHSEEYVNLRLAAAVLGDADAWPVPPPEPAAPQAVGPLFDYQYQDFDGGTLVVSLVLVPLAAVGGLSILTVKLGALLWAVATLLAWVAVARRLFGPDGGVWAAAALATAPVPWWILSCIHWGNHAESTLFPPLVILLLLVAADRKRWWAGLLLVPFAGLLAGFGVWFSLLNLLPLVLTAALLPLLFRWRSLAALPLFVGSAAVGFLPWLGRNESFSPGRVGAQGTSLSDVVGSLGGQGATQGGTEVLAVWPRFASWDLPGLWSWPDAVRPTLDLVCRLGIVAAAVVVLVLAGHLLVRGSDRRTALRRLFVAAVGVGCCLALPVLLDSVRQLCDRRLAPVYVFGQALIALGLVSVWQLPRGRIPALVAAAILLLPNLAAQVGVFASWDRPDDRLRPWIYFAVPADHPRARLEAGVPDVASHEVGPLNRVLDELLRSSTTGGREEMQGLRVAFGTAGGLGSGALRRYPPTCPSDEVLDQAGPSVIYLETQARALGMGLAIRCSGQRAEALARCDRVRVEVRSACRAGVEEAPR